MESDFWRDCPLIEIIPGKLDGRPLIKDTRVEADLVPELIEDGQTLEQIAEVYRLSLNDVLAIRDYALSRVDTPAATG